MKKLNLDDFETFSRQKRATKDTPVFAVIKGGRMSISKAAVDMYFKEAKNVVFHYHKKEQIIALKLLKRSTAESYDIKLHKSGHGVINSQKFFKHYEIDVSRKREMEILEVNEKDGLIFLKVADAKDKG